MSTPLKVGGHVSWNSEAAKVSGSIIRIHTKGYDYKGYRRQASVAEPHYETRNDKSDHIVAHKGSALTKL